MVAEPEHERDRAQLHDLGQDEPDGWGGLGMPDEFRPSVLQGDGGDAVGAMHTPLPLWCTPPVSEGEGFAVARYIPPWRVRATPPMSRGRVLRWRAGGSAPYQIEVEMP